ncbi:MAG: zonular occludens toxin domain-containing protein [Candidatus Nanopelagicales bacterium]
MTASAVRLRRSVPISAFIGANGSGKSALAVEGLRVSLAEGRPVLSAVRLLDPDARECEHPLCDAEDHGQDGHRASHRNWVPLRRLNQIMDFQGGDIFLDEVGALVSARESQSLPPQVAALLQQLRKRDTRLVWTAPSWARADKILREVTMLATVCKGYGDRRFPGREWRGRRLLHAVSYHAADLDDFEISKVNSPHAAVRPRKQAAQWVRVKNLRAIDCYDTFEPVPSIGFASQAGTCVDCGGRRMAPKCECSDYVSRVAPTSRAKLAVLNAPQVLQPESGVR